MQHSKPGSAFGQYGTEWNAKPLTSFMSLSRITHPLPIPFSSTESVAFPTIYQAHLGPISSITEEVQILPRSQPSVFISPLDTRSIPNRSILLNPPPHFHNRPQSQTRHALGPSLTYSKQTDFYPPHYEMSKALYRATAACSTIANR